MVKQPLQLALMITPLFLLVPRSLTSREISKEAMFRVSCLCTSHSNKTNIFNQLAVALGNQNRPPLLVHIENMIWRALFELADPNQTTSAFAVLKQLYTNIPWDSLKLLDPVERHWFSFAPSPVEQVLPAPLSLVASSFVVSSSSSSSPVASSSSRLYALGSSSSPCPRLHRHCPPLLPKPPTCLLSISVA